MRVSSARGKYFLKIPVNTVLHGGFMFWEESKAPFFSIGGNPFIRVVIIFISN